MSDNSFDSEALSDESIEEEDTKSQTDKDKEKAKGNSPEEKEIKNLELINSISKALNTILDKNKNVKNYKDILKKQISMYFSANTIPNISIKDYLIRIQNYCEMERGTLILSLILIDKMCRKSGIVLTHYNIHRILFSSVLVSIKYNEDSYFDNNFYSQIAGVKPDELKLLEYTFLEYNDFNIYVEDIEYEQYEKYLNLTVFD